MNPFKEPTKQEMLDEIFAYISKWDGIEVQPTNKVKRLPKFRIAEIYKVYGYWKNETGERFRTGVDTINAHMRIQVELNT